MISWLTGLKAFQALPNVLGGAAMITDPLHGGVSAEMVGKLSLPLWFPFSIGAYKLTQTALNWMNGGTFTVIAQFLDAFKLGGAAYMHSVLEKKPFANPGQVPVLLFFGVGLSVQAMHGKLSLPAALLAHGSLFVGGYAMGHIVSAFGGRPGAGLESPQVAGALVAVTLVIAGILMRGADSQSKAD